MPREVFWGLNTSTWVSGTEHYVGTRPYVGISFRSSDTFLQFSGSSGNGTPYESLRWAVQAGSAPSDTAVSNATPVNFNTERNYSTTTSSFSDSTTLHVKAFFYSGSGGTGNYDTFNASLTKSGTNTNTGSLIWRAVSELHVYDGSVWRRIDPIRIINISSALGTSIEIGGFPLENEWNLAYVLDNVAPAGYQLSVKDTTTFAEYGPFSIGGTSSGNIFSILGSIYYTYRLQILNASNSPIGDSLDIVVQY